MTTVPTVITPAFDMPSPPGYFEAMGIPLRRGRLLDEHDMADSPVAVLISESLATRKFPGRDPLGQTCSYGPLILAARTARGMPSSVWWAT